LERDIVIKYSVVVPVFNSFSSLRVILDWFSLEYNERNGDIELIIVDDGSTERPVYSIEHAGVRFFRKNNGGVSSARNLGIKESVGEYVLFLDSDDMFAKGIFNTLDGDVVNNVDVVFFSFQKESMTGLNVVRNKAGLVTSKEGLESFLTKKCKIHICSLAVRRDCLKNNHLSFTEGIHFSEDVLFLVTLLVSANKCQFITDVLYTYNMRNDSAMASPVSHRNLTHLMAFERMHALANGENNINLNFFLATCYANLLKNLLTSKAFEYRIIDEILSGSACLFRPIGLRPNFYGVVILISRGYILLDKSLNQRISHKIFKRRVR
jgi:glycosyltransferase involved in cell wall biosynthesis